MVNDMFIALIDRLDIIDVYRMKDRKGGVDNNE
jgi:hypothetical protein